MGACLHETTILKFYVFFVCCEHGISSIEPFGSCLSHIGALGSRLMQNWHIVMLMPKVVI